MMLRLIVLFLALFASVGCDAKKGDANKDQPQGGPTSPPAKEAAQDPRGAQAKRLADVLEGHRKTIGANLDNVTKAVQIAKDQKDFTDVKVVEMLRNNAIAAISNVNQMNEELLALDRELRHGQNAFLAYAQAFRDRSEDYADYSLKDSCLAWAAHYDRLAKGIPEERARVAEFQKHVPPLLEYMRETRRLLDDYHLFLTTYHDKSFPASEAAEYQSRFKSFLGQFDGFQRFIDLYRTPGTGGSKGGTAGGAVKANTKGKAEVPIT
jgi:hypothetical protein